MVLPEQEVSRVVHVALPGPYSGAGVEAWEGRFARAQEDTYVAVVGTAQALVRSRLRADLPVLVVTSGTQRVLEGDLVLPELSPVQGACLAASQEYPNLRFRLLDVDTGADLDALAESIVAESVSGAGAVVARRNGRRLVRRFRQCAVPAPNWIPLEGA